MSPEKNRISSWLLRLRYMFIHALTRLFWLWPVQPNKVVFVSFYGAGFGDNGKAIAQSLLKKTQNIDLVWAAKAGAQDTVPAPIRYVKYGSLRYCWELATAAVWVDNARKTEAVIKRKGQYYVQTWHGNLGFKKIEAAAETVLDSDYVKRAKHDAAMTNLMLSGSDFFTNLCRTIFWYDGEVLECGTPRLDVFYSVTESQKKEIKARLGIPADKRIVLYAPTFRRNQNLDCYSLDPSAVSSLLEKQTGEPWVVAIRLHPNIADKAAFFQYSDTVINVTDYLDLYELISVTDLVISDYSSLMFEAGMIRKPIFIFAVDLEDYIRERGFYFDIHEVPFPLSQSNEELLRTLAHFDYNTYVKELRRFYSNLGIHEDGTAADKTAEKILGIMGQL